MEELTQNFRYFGSEPFGKRYVHFYRRGEYIDHCRWMWSRELVPGDEIAPFNHLVDGKYEPWKWIVTAAEEPIKQDTIYTCAIHVRYSDGTE